MTTPRPQWHYGNHPPACTCVSCVARRSGSRPGRRVWRGRDISPDPRPAPMPVPRPAKKGGKGWMAALFLLGLIVGGVAVWWWSTGGPKSFGQANETVRRVARDVGQKAPPSSNPSQPTPVPVIAPATSPIPERAREESATETLVSTSVPRPTEARTSTAPPPADVPTSTSIVSPTVASVPVPTTVPTLIPTPTPAGTPVHLLSPLEIMRLVDQGKLTEEEAVAILNQSQGEMYISLDRTVGGHPFGA